MIFKWDNLLRPQIVYTDFTILENQVYIWLKLCMWMQFREVKNIVLVLLSLRQQICSRSLYFTLVQHLLKLHVHDDLFKYLVDIPQHFEIDQCQINLSICGSGLFELYICTARTDLKGWRKITNYTNRRAWKSPSFYDIWSIPVSFLLCISSLWYNLII